MNASSVVGPVVPAARNGQRLPTRRTHGGRCGDWPDDAYRLDWSVAELATFYEDQGKFPVEIAADLAGDLSRSEVADRFRRAGDLAPEDDYRVLHELYYERDWSTTEIAERACDGVVTSETIAYRLHQFWLHKVHSHDRLAAMDPDELDFATDETVGRDKRRVRA
ncbi:MULTISPECIES: hypothetical protein [Natrinema]|uniref:Uncharacterized protein n=2 Tax=Natrinema TaxID=88723 RepID=M0CIC4_9EURY|nr:MULTISPECIES: hypothetical protein [Natrinema]ELZ21639.1 hypothetical protein C476_07926 [Natrinema limicola JCM 13563]SDD89487.1 hypothetical protein SAMN05192552_106610 [Natrinema hispanicum]